MSTASELPSGDHAADVTGLGSAGEREDATIGRSQLRCARVRLAIREPERGHQPDGDGAVPQNAMHPWAKPTSKQILPESIFRSVRRESDAKL